MPPRPLEYIYPGLVAAQAIHVAVQFRIPDLLARGPKTADELAAECGAHAPTLDRLLRALTSLDMFRQTPDRRYTNTPLTEILRTDQPMALHAVARFLPAPYLWSAIGGLSGSVRTGEPAFNRVFGQSFFDYLGSHPEEASVFNQVMALEIAWVSPGILRAYDFSRFKTLVDVGGGQGAFLRDILIATPTLRGILFDQPQVVVDAEKILTGEIAKRATIAAGSFFDRVPEGGDAYILKRIIHDWMDDDAAKILRNVRRAIAPGGTLLLIDALVDSQTHPAGLADLMMLVLGGCERTEAEFRTLLKSADFSLTRIVPAGAYSLIEGQPV
jgi:hypothetical protein